MKTVISVLTAHFFVLSAFIWLASPACADSGSDYKAGSDFAKQVQGNGGPPYPWPVPTSTFYVMSIW